MADSFVFYKSFYEAIKSMPDEAEQAKAYKYICEYVFEEKEPRENNFARAMFYMVKVDIANANKRYNASVENGKKGGAPKGNQNAKKQPKNNLESTENQSKNKGYFEPKDIKVGDTFLNNEKGSITDEQIKMIDTYVSGLTVVSHDNFFKRLDAVYGVGTINLLSEQQAQEIIEKIGGKK